MAAVASEKMMDLTQPSAPPISQSMDNHYSPTRFSTATDSQSREPAPDSPDRSLASSTTPSRQLDFKSQLSSRVEEYRQLFRLPQDEDLIQDFNCALQENFLLQGHMYLFVHYVCFYSNLFGFETKKIIPFHEVTSVRRANAVAVFPTAIEIIAGGKKYFFTSFLSRDEAFKLLNDGWSLHSNESKEITGSQGIKSDMGNQENGSTMIEKADCSGKSVDKLEPIERDKDGPVSEDFKLSSVNEPEIVLTSSTMQDWKEENAEATQSIECSASGKFSAWEPEDVDAPGVPECYTKVAESKFPIQVEEFFHLFFSDNGVSFQESFHRKCGDKDFKCSSWKPHDKFGHICDVSFQHPIKIYFGARFGSCQQVQKYRVYRNDHLIVETSQVISDVPYGDYFSVEGRWDVERDGNDSKPGCILRVYIYVSFSKKTMWRGKIVQSTEEECREVYAIWIDLAHEVLKQKNLEREEGGGAANQVRLEKQANTEIPMNLKATVVKVSPVLPDVKNANHQVADPSQGNLSDASVGSMLRNTITKFFSSLRQQNTSSLLLVITIAIVLLLMQISILVLLSRPQRIQLITQADYMSRANGISSNRAEALTSLNRQIKYLKEEMHFVETLLEKMQHEHALLKGKLEDLDLFKN